MAKAMNVADYVIKRSEKIGQPVSNLKLQKIMYFLNVIHLLKCAKRPLITDSNFEKWMHGPVIRSVYRDYSANGAEPIVKPIRHIKEYILHNDGTADYKPYDEKELELDIEDKKFINKYLEKLLRFNPFELVKYSHEEPQWNDKSDIDYNQEYTYEYYLNKKNRFWD
ncbi:Panacea domain-containing protein [Fructilactobacillus fructivorans]|uniref:Panacea domain-containing protein n=1 Tax=Fructilactobacillus fructivorans TaxID=1614 RepID=UPI000704EA86|nr:type II toxin-antitoxin system antitoxin SocA domain-containing protein [Fructilactobacillus fructivorans]KRN41372.1 phage protein [Fructilactobacillus fructivorans]KRN42827.1 phage protein [Fructilactobacillus fructivorans]